MADEVTVQSSLQIRKSPISYMGQPSVFRADMTGAKGPCIGAVTARHTGTIIDFSQLTQPGFYRVQNLDDDEEVYVEIGPYDPQTNKFYPMHEIGPGESYVNKFSRNLNEEYAGTGTGTSAATNSIMLKCSSGNVDVLVEVFEA